MSKCRRWRTGLAVLALLGLCHPVRAGIVTFAGLDAGVGPGGVRPNSNAAAASFDTAATLLGPVQTMTFEGLTLNTPTADNTPITIGTGVSLSVSGTDHAMLAGFPFGVSNNTPDPVNDGYNTTSGGSQFFEFVPNTSVTTATMTLTFAQPAQAFGAFLTGLGTAAGSLSLVFNDGKNESFNLTGSATGGVQFFGFTDAGASFNSIQFVMTGFTPTSRDTFGVDDVRVGLLAPPVPEPASAVLVGLGILGLAAPIAGRRLARRGRVRRSS